MTVNEFDGKWKKDISKGHITSLMNSTKMETSNKSDEHIIQKVSLDVGLNICFHPNYPRFLRSSFEFFKPKEIQSFKKCEVRPFTSRSIFACVCS